MTAALASLAQPRRLSRGHKLALAGEILVTYVRVRLSLRRHDVRTTVRRLRGDAADTRAIDAQTAGRRLGRVVTRVLDPLPADTRCLTTSLVLCGLLARRGAGGRVVIGVRPGEPFGAHAWVELGGRPLLPRMAPEFKRLVEL